MTENENVETDSIAFKRIVGDEYDAREQRTRSIKRYVFSIYRTDRAGPITCIERMPSPESYASSAVSAEAPGIVGGRGGV